MADNMFDNVFKVGGGLAGVLTAAQALDAAGRPNMVSVARQPPLGISGFEQMLQQLFTGASLQNLQDAGLSVSQGPGGALSFTPVGPSTEEQQSASLGQQASLGLGQALQEGIPSTALSSTLGTQLGSAVGVSQPMSNGRMLDRSRLISALRQAHGLPNTQGQFQPGTQTTGLSTGASATNASPFSVAPFADFPAMSTPSTSSRASSSGLFSNPLSTLGLVGGGTLGLLGLSKLLGLGGDQRSSMTPTVAEAINNPQQFVTKFGMDKLIEMVNSDPAARQQAFDRAMSEGAGAMGAEDLNNSLNFFSPFDSNLTAGFDPLELGRQLGIDLNP